MKPDPLFLFFLLVVAAAVAAAVASTPPISPADPKSGFLRPRFFFEASALRLLGFGFVGL